MRAVSHHRIPVALAACIAAALAASNSNAQVNAGVEAGIAARSSTPALDPGAAIGAHAEVKPLPMISVGAYYLYYQLGIADAPSTVQSVSFRALGGRVRLTLPLPGSDMQPYLHAGLGRVGVTYPVATTFDPAAVTSVSFDFDERDGWFLEAPVAIGLGLKAAKIIQLSVEFGVRPSFAFNGNAYEDPTSPFGTTTMGYTGLLGLALDL